MIARKSGARDRQRCGAARLCRPYTMRPIAGLGRHPRLIGPVMQLLRRFRLTSSVQDHGKAPSMASLAWHQDTAPGARDDKDARSTRHELVRVVSRLRVTEVQRLALHHPAPAQGRGDRSRPQPLTTSYPLGPSTRNGRKSSPMKAACSPRRAKPGSVLRFHSNIVHASSNQTSAPGAG